MTEAIVIAYFTANAILTGLILWVGIVVEKDRPPAITLLLMVVGLMLAGLPYAAAFYFGADND